MAEKQVWRCIICATRAEGKPPHRCPTCGAPSGRWRLVVDWKAEQKFPPPTDGTPPAKAA